MRQSPKSSKVPEQVIEPTTSSLTTLATPSTPLDPSQWTEIQDLALTELVARNTFNNGFIDFDKVWWELRSGQPLITHKGSRGCKERWDKLQERLNSIKCTPILITAVDTTSVDSGPERVNKAQPEISKSALKGAVSLDTDKVLGSSQGTNLKSLDTSVSSKRNEVVIISDDEDDIEMLEVPLPISNINKTSESSSIDEIQVSSTSPRPPPPPPAGSPPPEAIPISVPLVSANSKILVVPQKARSPSPPILPFSLRTYLPGTVGRFLSASRSADIESNNYEASSSLSPLTDIDLESYGSRDYEEDDLEEAERIYREEMWEGRNEDDFYDEDGYVGIASDEEPVEAEEAGGALDSSPTKITVHEKTTQQINKNLSRKRSTPPIVSTNSESGAEQPSSPKRTRISSPTDKPSISPTNSSEVSANVDTSISLRKEEIPTSLPALKVVRIRRHFPMPAGFFESKDAWARCEKAMNEDPYWQ